MKAKVKILGLALIAALAMSVFTASGAQAAPELEAEAEGTVTITGEQFSAPEHPNHSFTSGSRVLSCATAKFEGTLEPNPDPSVTLTPVYSNCTASGLPVTVTHNGCNYTFYGGETGTGLDHYVNGTVDVVCPKGKAIEAHIYTGSSSHASGSALCTITVPSQTGRHGNTSLNTPSEGTVDVTSTVTTETIVHGSDFFCGPENQVSTYTGATKLRGYSDAAHTEQVPIRVVH